MSAHLSQTLGVTVLALGLCAAANLRAAGLAAGENQAQQVTHAGVRVGFSVESLARASTNAPLVRADEDVVVRFSLSDETTGAPLKDVYPEAWIDARPPPQVEGSLDAVKQIQNYRSGSLFARPLVDLNVYYVLTLNDDATVGVVDPLFGFGGSKLLALVKLNSPGHDWALSADQSTLFVSLPESDQVAVLDTRSWQVRTNLPAGHRPTRLALQPDGQNLWVSTERAAGSDIGGIMAFDTVDLGPRAWIKTGRGSDDLVFSGNSRWLYTVNRAEGTVSVVDTLANAKLRELQVGPAITSADFSREAQALYVTDSDQGTITIIDGQRNEIVRRIQSDPGLSLIRFTPGQRYGVVVNPHTRSVSILDAAKGQIVQKRNFEAAPAAVAFSDRFAYITSLISETVMMAALAGLGEPDAPLSCSDFPGGQHPAGMALRPAAAAGIVSAPGESAVLIANAPDKAVYYYKEGMAAPMGHFNNYDREPRAVLALDRTLRVRKTAGLYETTTRIPGPGRYNVFFYLNAPRFAHCFTISVAESEADSERPRIELADVTNVSRVSLGESVRLAFRATDPVNQESRPGIRDFGMLVVLAPGSWHHWYTPKESAGGIYALDFTPPQPGLYDVFVQSRSMQFAATRLRTLMAVPSSLGSNSATPSNSNQQLQ